MVLSVIFISTICNVGLGFVDLQLTCCKSFANQLLDELGLLLTFTVYDDIISITPKAYPWMIPLHPLIKSKMKINICQ